MAKSVPFALYDCFSASAFGGSQAAVVTEAAAIDAGTRERIAKELGFPATAFVTTVERRAISVRFLSTVMELPMCGHGTMGLMTRMTELGRLDWNGEDSIDVALTLPNGTAAVTVSRREDGRPLVMLDVKVPAFRSDKVDPARLAGLLGLGPESFSGNLPIETAVGDFIHLVVPMRSLDAMHRIKPDFGGMVRLFHEHGIETIAVFSTEVERPGSTVHLRDFCPAVGVAESAAAGTTNAALSSYLVRHGVARDEGNGQINLRSEQGMELGRPSEIRSRLSVEGGRIRRLSVGGVATKIAEGMLLLPEAGQG
jgi:PhzF family phenazine biosynthesis protein